MNSSVLYDLIMGFILDVFFSHSLEIVLFILIVFIWVLFCCCFLD